MTMMTQHQEPSLAQNEEENMKTTDATGDDGHHTRVTTAPTRPISRILLASCHHQPERSFSSFNNDYYTELWKSMASRQATALVWAGDAVYGDRQQRNKLGPWQPGTPELMRSLYRQMLLGQQELRPPGGDKEDPATSNSNTGHLAKDYVQEFLLARTPQWSLSSASSSNNDGTLENQTHLHHSPTPPLTLVYGTWDDHDYGMNNADETFPHRIGNALAFIDFLRQSTAIAQRPQPPRTSSSSPHPDDDSNTWTLMKRRAAQGRGVYGVKVLDFTRPMGQELLSDEEAQLDPDLWTDSSSTPTPSPSKLSHQSVAIFVLDVRSHKTPWKKAGRDKWAADPLGDFLGDEQWRWFEQALAQSTAAVHVVVQGLQVHADRFFDGNLAEDWSRYPTAQHRLMQALLQRQVQVPILVSGDVHMAQILRKDCRRGYLDDDRSIAGEDTASAPRTAFSSTSDPRMVLELTTSGLTHSWGTQLCVRTDDSWVCRIPYLQKCVAAGMHLAHQLPWTWTDLLRIPTNQAMEGSPSGAQYSLQRNFGELEFDWDQRQVWLRIHGENTINGASPLLSTVWDMDVLSGVRPIPPSSRNWLRPHHFDRQREQLARLVQGSQDSDWICIPYRGRVTLPAKILGVIIPAAFTLTLLSLPLIGPLLLTNILWKWLNRR